MVLLLVFMQLTRDLFAIAKFLFILLNKRILYIAYRREALKDAFSELEYGGNCSIRAHDLGTALRAIGQTPTEADIQELLQDAVLDGQLYRMKT